MEKALEGKPLNMKMVSLVTLTVQNSSLILVMHYSRVMPTEAGRYYASTAVLLNEIIKFVICVVVSIRQEGFQKTRDDVLARDCWKLAIPAALYTLQNTLQYTAVSNLDAATFQVTYQLKILTTAMFSVSMLDRSLSKSQWLALLLLTVGIALVQIPFEIIRGYVSLLIDFGGEQREQEVQMSQVADSDMNQFVGLTAVAVACLLSGLAGVYFEKVLKGKGSNTKPTSLWVRNIQLSFFSLFPALLLGVWAKDGAAIARDGFFYGYNSVVVSAVLLQAIGGIVVALCVKYADNIAKNFATSISILISSVVSVFFFGDFELTPNFAVGAVLVIYATYLYSK